jgi:hypothetical protein
MSRFPNVHFTKCPDYNMSRTQNFQFFKNLKICLKNFLNKTCKKLHISCGPCVETREEQHSFCFMRSIQSVSIRVSSKQTKIIFGSNRNKPKQDLFRVCFGLFRETNSKKFRFFSVFRTYIETTETNRTVS